MASSPPRPMTEREERTLDRFVKLMTTVHVTLFRASRGRLGSRFFGGASVCLLTSIGRRSGRERTVPLIYLRDAERVVLVASKAGSARSPVWYHNLVANPECRVQIGSEVREMRATRASAAEKAELWPRLLEVYPPYGDYQARTERDIPVLVLSPK